MPHRVEIKDMSDKRTLILFTRYPEVGKVKTRLTESISPEMAAELHKKMTEDTLCKMKEIPKGENTSLKIFYEGGSYADMKKWLGDFKIKKQAGKNLGERLCGAFRKEFEKKTAKVVVVGSDCPGLTATIIKKAFLKLAENDLVIGPAEDGGYYLIGLKRPADLLFKDISWGTDKVLAETEKVAGHLNMNIYKLQTLSDVDRPQDLKMLD